MAATLKYKDPVTGKWENIGDQTLPPVPVTPTPLKGVKVSAIADSTLTVSDNAVDWLAKVAKIVPQNLAISGTGFATGDNYTAQISKIDKAADIIIVGVGFNDTRRGLPIGNVDDVGTGSLSGYVNDFISALEAAFPTTALVFFSEGCTKDRHPGVEIADQWHNAVEAICRKRCIPFYRGLYDGSVLKPWVDANRAYYYRDNAHLNSAGGKVMGKYLYRILLDNVSPDIYFGGK